MMRKISKNTPYNYDQYVKIENDKKYIIDTTKLKHDEVIVCPQDEKMLVCKPDENDILEIIIERRASFSSES